MPFESVKELIVKNIPDAIVEIVDLTGTRDHLGITVFSQQFKDKSLIEQHQVLMDILKERLKSDIHAVKLKTSTIEKAKEKGLIP